MNATLAPTFTVPSGQAHDGPPLQIFDDVIRIKVRGEDTAGQFAIFEGVTRPQCGPPLHVHHREDEAFFILEGEFLFEVDGQGIPAKAGDFVYAPRGTRHCFRNVGQTDARMLVTVQPAGLDDFFEDLAKLNGPPDPATAAPIFEKHGLELLGPPSF